jgi:hypothetical protein
MVEKSRPLLAIPGIPGRMRELIKVAIGAAENTTKFLLPDHGMLLEDNALKALSDDELHLPYESIALEYAYPDDPEWVQRDDAEQCSKRILFATEFDDSIQIVRSQFADRLGVWVTAGPVLLPKSNWANRSMLSSDGRFALSLADVSGQTDFDPQTWRDSFADDAWVLVSFLNALACSNVTAQPLQQPAPIPGRQQKKPSKTQDVYHVLGLTYGADQSDAAHGASGSGGTKREHMRRGHIRRLADGRKLWINAVAVNAGRNFGRVTKSYQLKAQKQTPTQEGN